MKKVKVANGWAGARADLKHLTDPRLLSERHEKPHEYYLNYVKSTFPATLWGSAWHCSWWVSILKKMLENTLAALSSPQTQNKEYVVSLFAGFSQGFLWCVVLLSVLFLVVILFAVTATLVRMSSVSIAYYLVRWWCCLQVGSIHCGNVCARVCLQFASKGPLTAGNACD